MPIPDHHRTNFDTLLRAARDGDLCLMQCIRRSDGTPVSLLCAVSRNEIDEFVFSPFAELIEGNPYDRYNPPATVPRS